MKIQDLRVGNLITYEDIIYEVFGYDFECDLNLYRQNEITKEGINIYCTIIDVKPIKLTEEILFECGFVNEQDEINGVYYNIYYQNKKCEVDFVIETFINDSDYYLTHEGNVISVGIKYLHELQNIIFFLTRHEIEIDYENI